MAKVEGKRSQSRADAVAMPPQAVVRAFRRKEKHENRLVCKLATTNVLLDLLRLLARLADDDLETVATGRSECGQR